MNSPIMYQPPVTTAPGKQPGGGSWVWNAAKGIFEWAANNAGDILGTAGSLIEGYMSSQDRAKQLAELARQYDESLKQRQSEATTSNEQFGKTLAEQQANRLQSSSQFDRTTGDSEAQQAVRAQTQLNAAPIADKSQALLLARMGVTPGQFQGRDYTKGTSDLTRSPVAPSANVTSAMQAAAKGYKPGQGGVDTSVIKMLLEKMKGSAFHPQTPIVGPVDMPNEWRKRPPERPTTPLPTRFQPPTPDAPPPSYPPAASDDPDHEPDRDADESYTSPGDIIKRRMGLMT